MKWCPALHVYPGPFLGGPRPLPRRPAEKETGCWLLRAFVCWAIITQRILTSPSEVSLEDPILQGAGRVPGPKSRAATALRMTALSTEHPLPFRRHLAPILFYVGKFQLANTIVSVVTYDTRDTKILELGSLG